MNKSIAIALVLVAVVVVIQSQVIRRGGRGNFGNSRAGYAGRGQNRYGNRAQRQSGRRGALSARNGKWPFGFKYYFKQTEKLHT